MAGGIEACRRDAASLPLAPLSASTWPLSRRITIMRSGGRVVEGARLESEYAAKPHRGFESLPLRHHLFHRIEHIKAMK